MLVYVLAVAVFIVLDNFAVWLVYRAGRES